MLVCLQRHQTIHHGGGEQRAGSRGSSAAGVGAEEGGQQSEADPRESGVDGVGLEGVESERAAAAQRGEQGSVVSCECALRVR